MLKEFISVSLAALQIAVGSLSNPPVETKTTEIPYIIHAAGEIYGISGTNSLEAFENAYNKGNRYIELDFSFTEDLKPVCIHDWNYISFPGFEDTRPNYSEFSNGRVYGSLTPMTIDSVASFMASHEDLYIITDVKDYNIYFAGLLKHNYPELCDRFIIQVYSEEQYKYISQMGFEKIIFSLYRLSSDKMLSPEFLVNFAKENKLFAYTFNAELCEIDGYVEGMLKCGIPLFVHTINDKDAQQRYFDMGITGIYTDNTVHT